MASIADTMSGTVHKRRMRNWEASSINVKVILELTLSNESWDQKIVEEF